MPALCFRRESLVCGRTFLGHISGSKQVNWGQRMQLGTQSVSQTGGHLIFWSLDEVRIRLGSGFRK